ncbi:hypothetical protein [Actinoplanes sp. NPDC049599]|uniref:hypothetical protein n=1 Tax=Actinoplanes sp. NPDC049599 TaxID=3363903 RepID=UPI003790A4BD
MIRIFRIELRRSAARWAGLMVLTASAGLLYSARERWTAGYMILAMDQRWYLSLLTGLAVAAGAWQARREHASRVTELFASVPRPRAHQVVPMLLVYGVVAFVAYVGAWSLAALRIVGTAEYLPAGAVAGVVVAGAVAVVAAAWFGLVVGRMLPSVLTAPALAVATFATPLVARGITGRREWLSTLLFPGYGLGGDSTDFATVPGRFSIAQMLYLTGLAAGAALLFAAAQHRARIVALAPALLGAAAAVLILQGGAAFVRDPVDPAARELVCTGDAPHVCVARVHSGVLDEVTPPARAALAKLARLPGAPSRAEEDLSPMRQVGEYPDSMLVPLTIGDDGHVNHRDRLESIMLDNVGVLPFVCPDEATGPDAAVVDAATSWLLGTAAHTARAGDLLLTLRGLDEQEAAARVGAVRRAILTCSSGDDLLTRPAS